jgi:hypothetical protein
MNNAQWARFQTWISVQSVLTQAECTGCTDLDAWFNDWRLYTKNGGDVPPVKPPKP